jgi:tRNA U38,U39,U40 pseudouridine synthase TruA
MIRRIVGVLVAVGRGKVEPENVPRLTAAPIARWPAPPSGLFLKYVRYFRDDLPDLLIPAFAFRQNIAVPNLRRREIR